MISGNVPLHLVSTAKAGFLTTALKATPDYAPIAKLIDLSEKNQTLVDLGAAPMPTRTKSGPPSASDFIEKTLPITSLDWHIKVPISGNAVKDDQTGSLLGRVRAAGSNFQRHISQQAFKTLNDGDNTALSGIGYDGNALFANDHADKGAFYTTAQDNLDANALSLANFQTTYIKASLTRDDQGNFTQYGYDLLVVPPNLETLAWQITNVRGGTEAITNANPYAGSIKYIVSPMLDSTAWVLVASNETIKPILVVMREQPFLDDAWKDPDGDDGGTYWFLFRGRYSFYVGAWQTAYLGNS